METEIIKIDKLQDVSQWTTWRFQVRVCLNASGLFSIASGDEKCPETADVDASAAVKTETERRIVEWKQKDAKAQRIIVTSIGSKPMQHILRCESSTTMWTKLHAIYEQKHEAGKQLLQEQFYAFKGNSSDDIATHISKLDSLVQQLKDMNIVIGDEMVITKLLMTLPSEYNHFSSAWDSTPVAERTLENLTNRLMVEEYRINSRKCDDSSNKSEAFLAHKNSSSHKKKSHNASKANNKPQKGRCFKCNSDQHYKRFCPELNKSDKENNSKKSNESRGNGQAKAFLGIVNRLVESMETPKAFLSHVDESIVKAAKSDAWYVDSGATEHMCNRIEWFEQYNEFQNKVPVTIGNGSIMHGIGSGIIKVLSFTGEKWIPKTLNKVLYVPNGYVNLFASNKALDNGHTMKADAKLMEFYDEQNVVAIATRKADLFELVMKVVESSDGADSKANVAMKTLSLQMWHERLGHQNVKYVRNFLNNRNIHFNDEEFDCDGCAYGKQHRLSFESREIKSKSCGEIIHADVCGPIDKSIGGSLYFVVFKDDFSHMRFVYCLKKKSEVFERFKAFVKLSEKECGHSIKAFQSDNGTEFVNDSMESFLAENGIRHRRSVPHTPQQNGCAEREMRTINESARAMLHAKGLSLNLWAEAVNSAVYVLNRTGTSTVKDKTPYELWYGKLATVDHFRTFGAEVYVHIPKTKRHKMESKSKKCIFVGYGENVKVYRIYDPETRKVELVRDVKFLLDEFATIKIVTQLNNDQHIVKEKSVQTDNQSESNEVSQEEEQTNSQVPEKVKRRRSTVLDGMDESNIIENRLRPINEVSALISMAMISIQSEPRSYQEAIESIESEKWLKAMKEEIDSLSVNNTWILVQKPLKQKVIDCKWVFKIKNNPDDTIERYKARLVARGFNQEHGIDYEETFSPVVRYDSIRAILAIVAAKKLKMKQFDVKTAFLYGDLKEDVFMKQPKGFYDGSDKVCKLRKSLYGLKQSSRCWNQKFKDFIVEFGFEVSSADPCVFTKNTKEETLILCIYVDDGMIFGNSDESIDLVIDHLQRKFEVKVINAGWFLGMEIDRLNDGSIFIHQTAYARKIIKKFQMDDCNSVGVPSDTNQRLTQHDDSESSNYPYRQLIGSLLYLANGTRPDISYAIGVASRYLENPSISHVNAAKRILKYIKGTMSYGILYGSTGKIIISGYSDSDYAGCLDTRRSTTGYVFTLNGSAITWCSRRQASTTRSTAEAEYIAASEASSELVWLNRLLGEIVPNQFDTPILHIDNESALKLVKNPVLHRRTKHIDVAYHFIRDKYDEGEFSIESISTHDQLADSLTKALPKARFEFLREMIGITKMTN